MKYPDFLKNKYLDISYEKMKKQKTQMKQFNLIISITILTIVLSAFRSHAQQEAMYSQYMFNTLSLNPAYAGTKEIYNATLLQRHQWVGYDGAPTTTSLSVSSPYFFKRIGLGFTYVRDEIGPLVTNNIFVDIATRIQVHRGGYFAGGIKAGFDGRKTALSELDPLDPSDELYASDAVKKMAPNFGAGVYYYTDNYYVGLSSPKVAQTKIPYSGGSSGEQVKRHYYFIAGYVHALTMEWKLRPSCIIKKVAGAPYSFDITGAAMYQEKIIGGISYRVGDSFGAMVQYRPIPQLWIGYVYDFLISELSRYNSGTHEIMVSFDFDFKKKDIVKSPRFF